MFLTFSLTEGRAAVPLRGATAVATITNGSVATIEITDGGSGYVAPPNVAFIDGGGSGASALAQVTAGAVSAILLETSGSGYTSAPAVAIDPPPPLIPPAVLSISLIPRLRITGQAWTVQQVQYADALGGTNQWFTLTNVVLGDVPFVLIDTSAPPGGLRFYRVVAVAAPGPDPARWAWLNAGTFTMGSPLAEFDRSDDESPQAEVTFSRGFWIGRFEVTQGEYTAIVGTNYSTFAGDTNRPVEQVAWFDASNYCAALTQQEQSAGHLPAGYQYRLPTEAEWEYAARGGSTNRFFFGADRTYTLLLNYAWIETNSLGSTHEVGGKQPNPWGIYDMSGNVWEWCADWYGPYVGGTLTDPSGPATGTDKVMRGGSWRFAGGDARPAARNFNPPDFASDGIGFRVVLGPAAP
jgi:formylglycine-generating enzyme required for sulfatase activity